MQTSTAGGAPRRNTASSRTTYGGPPLRVASPRDTASSRTTWGGPQTERRVAEGVDRACRIVYGRRHARLLAGVTALSLWLESAAPGRSSEHRRRFRTAAADWRAIATGR